MMERLHDLAQHAWEQHRRADRAQLAHLVRPSIPILFFGNSRRFVGSPLRVITVGLNPSREEFPRGAPFRRFPGSERLNRDNINGYLAALDQYFENDPYRGWFNQAFEPLLRGLGASYYDAEPSAALHTDLCSPLATDPTWSRLSANEKAALEPSGRQLWHDLVEALQPDVVVISIARAQLSKITFPLVDSPSVVHTIAGPTRVRPYRIEKFRHKLASGKAPLFVFGNASQTPFGSVSAVDKRQIGSHVLEALHV